VSIALTKQDVKTILQGITSPKALARVYDNPKEATSIGEFPCAIISLAPQIDHTWSMAAQGLARHDYSLVIWIIVNARSAGLPNLLPACEIWPEPIARALFQHLTLDGDVEWIGSVDTPNLFTYQIGPIAWASQEPEFFGVRITLPTTEKPVMEMGG
jgi:hypothetical protein